MRVRLQSSQQSIESYKHFGTSPWSKVGNPITCDIALSNGLYLSQRPLCAYIFEQMKNNNERFLAIRTVMLPKDTNHLGSIFGGVILSLLDLAAGEHAKNIVPKKYLTKLIREVNFISPVFVGDAVSFYTSTVRTGKTSLTVKVDVEVQRGLNTRETLNVTSAEVVMVAVDDQNKPISIN